MSGLQALPGWVAILVSLLVFGGALLACIGCLGMLGMRTFYQRVHTPTLGTTLGLYLILLGAILFFSFRQGQPILHLVLIGVCISVTTPITLMLLVRAALVRDRREGAAGVPPADPSDDDKDDASSDKDA